MKSTLLRAGLVALTAGLIAGCGGGGGGEVAATPPPVTPPPSGPTLPAAPVPTGTTTVDVTTLSTEQMAALQPAIDFGGALVASPPQVSFAVKDDKGNPIVGLGAKSGDNLTYLRFTIAKLVPGADGAPSKWVSYIVVASPTSTSAQRPNVERTGTLVDNKNGTYTYTFANDITKVKDQVAAMTMSGANVAADLGDLTYVPTLTHRIAIQLSGGGMNTANGFYDFVPQSGAVVAKTEADGTKQRQVVSIDNCNECHGKLALHGGGRIDTQFCVLCHTDQRRFGQTNITSSGNPPAFPTLNEKQVTDPETGFVRYLYSKNTTTTSSSYHPDGTDPTYVADGETIGDFPRMVHKIHMGADLTKQNYNYANLVFNLKHFSMLEEGQRMCTKCHDNAKAAQADNWKNVPSRLACGACHDKVNFATGSNHVGGIQTSDKVCALCHAGDAIAIYHRTDNVTTHNPVAKEGLVNFKYEISSAKVETNNDVTVVFKITADGTPLTTLTPTGFTGGPGFLLAWAVPQDNIAAPADFNNTTNTKGDASSVSFANSTITGPDANGYFTATIASARGFPAGAKMRTVALQSYYTQSAGTGGIAAATGRHAISVVKTVAGDTERRKVVDAAKCGNCHEWLELHGGSRVIGKETTGNVLVCVTCHVPAKATSGRGLSDTVVNTYDARGGFSSSDKAILKEWGMSTTFPVTVGSNWALGLPVAPNNFKDMIHGIHKGRERVTPFRDARDRTSSGGAGGAIALLDFRRLDFPGIINNCETCHDAGKYASVPSGALASTYESINADYAANYGLTTATTAMALASYRQPNATDKVTSPFAAACVSCHDSSAAQGHMKTNNARIQTARSVFAAAVATPGEGEACVTCHGAGRDKDVTVVHK